MSDSARGSESDVRLSGRLGVPRLDPAEKVDLLRFELL
jgi:hypothetical protein